MLSFNYKSNQEMMKMQLAMIRFGQHCLDFVYKVGIYIRGYYFGIL